MIRQLASAERIALFVGAGVSQEAGLPSWHQLVSQLLQCTAINTQPFRRMQEEQLPEASINASAQSYAAWLLSTHGPVAAAAMAKAWLTDAYSAALSAALYGDAPSPLRPGPTAKQIARLWTQGFSEPEHLTVLTTNYDTLVEQALMQEGVQEQQINSPTLGDNTRLSGFTVVHLHGILELAHGVQNIVLSEDDYYDSALRQRWVEWATQHQDAEWLLIGASLLDPNLLEFLYGRARDMRAAGEQAPQFIAVSVAQADQPAHVLDVGEEVLAAGRETADERLRRLALVSLRADYFCQNAQLLYEVTEARRRRLQGPGDMPSTTSASYRDRIERWESSALRTGLLPPPIPDSDKSRSLAEKDYSGLQRILNRALLVACRAIRGRMGEVPNLRNREEHLALHLWAHNPSGNCLTFIARSDQQFLNPFNLESVVIQMPTDRLVVESICTGTALAAADTDLRSSRWNSMLAVPLTPERGWDDGDDKDHGRLPLGVLVLASSAGNVTGLGRLHGTAEQLRLLSVLAHLGERLLTHRGERFDPRVQAPQAVPNDLVGNAVPRLSSGSRIVGPVPYSESLPPYWGALSSDVEEALGSAESEVC